jgi:hypothetical protein
MARGVGQREPLRMQTRIRSTAASYAHRVIVAAYKDCPPIAAKDSRAGDPVLYTESVYH